MKKLKVGPYDELQERVELELGKLPSDKQDRALGAAAATAGGVFAISMVNLFSPDTPIHLVLGALGTATSIGTVSLAANVRKNKKGNDENH